MVLSLVDAIGIVAYSPAPADCARDIHDVAGTGIVLQV